MRLFEVNDTPVARVDLSPLRKFFTPELEQLIAVIRHYGFHIRIIGGAVRDLLRQKDPRDIDLACDALPDELIYVLRKNHYDLDLKGLKHGTVKVVFEHNVPDREFEITALDYQIHDIDGHLDITFGRDWRQDALRRDFTINAMSADLDGNLYDYTDGLKDLQDQHVRFIGDYHKKITEDPVLILRFFKLLSSFPDPQFDKSLFVYIKENACLVDQIKPKRVSRELCNIQDGPNAERVFAFMKQIGIDHCLTIAEAQLPLGASSTDKLWAEINPADFSQWLQQVLPGDQKKSAAQNPERYRHLLTKFMAARIGFVSEPNFGIQI